VANSLSARKRARQDLKRRSINRARKSAVKTQIKHFETALSTGDVADAEAQYGLLTKKLDKVASTSTMHKNTAGRVKSRLSKRLNGLKTKKV